MAAHRAKKSGTKKAVRKGKKHGSTSWTRFCKAHKGKTIKQISKLYRAGGHMKKKPAKKAKRKAPKKAHKKAHKKSAKKSAHKGHKKAR